MFFNKYVKLKLNKEKVLVVREIICNFANVIQLLTI